MILLNSDVEKAKMAKVPYSSAVGSLMYAMVATRPDIAFAVGVVSRYMANPGKKHWEAVKHILKYLKGTSSRCLRFGNSDASIIGYMDSDYGGCADTRRSTSGYIFLFVLEEPFLGDHVFRVVRLRPYRG